MDSSSDSTSTASSDSDDEIADFDSTSSSQTSEELEVELMEMYIGLDGIPVLVPMDWRLSGEDSDSECESSSLGGNADGEMELESEGDDEDIWEIPSSRIAQWVPDSITDMYVHRYEEAQDRHKSHPPPQIQHCLEVTKFKNQEEFHELLCVTPQTFDKLVAKIKNDLVFFNNSNNLQLPVEEQLAITPYSFGHDSNAMQLAWHLLVDGLV